MASNLMICTSALKPLTAKKLNEAQEQGPKYILEGVFAELDKLNRNQRIYPKNEYLKHLAYLRDDIKKGEPLLGELDHPDDRFEVKLKEASHRVIDLWYDEKQNVVMGKIELLNTPNGKLAQSIVDQGIPLHISSRAAGSVNADNTVSIQQIYTYDLVCKPGFAGAVLHRVNESADAPKYTNDVRNFLQSSYKMESMNAAPQYGFVNEDVSVSEIKASANLRNEAKELQINNQIEINVEDMTKPLNENTNPDQTVGKPLTISGNGASALGIPTALEGDDNKDDDKKEDVSDKAPDANDKPAESSDNKKEDGEDEKCPKCGKNPCKCDDKKEDDGKKEKKSVSEKEDKDDDKGDDSEEDGEGSEGEGEDKSDSGVEIIEVEAEFEGDDKDDDMIKDVEPDFGDDDDDEDKDKEGEDKEGKGDKSSEDKPKEKDKTEEAERTVDCNGSKDKSSEKLYDNEKAKKEADKLADEAKDEIEDREDKLMKKLDDLRAAIEKKSKSKEESKNESLIMAQYPASMMMNESNFAEFVGLSESQKSKVVDYLRDNNFADKKSINENWKNGVNYVAETPAWLKYAPENYKALYEAASDTVKKSIATTASYLLFENQYDINSFWENSGLASANERKLLNESFVNVLPKVAPVDKESNLPYSNEYIKQIADMASEYNKK